jgi:alpha/beta superfamily hydrolase
MNIIMDARRQTAVTFRSDKLDLEGVIFSPADTGVKAPAVVVCHSHPFMGGDMDKRVVVSISQALAREGIFSLRFNFRGVGDSKGQHDEGNGEAKDIISALDFMAHWPGVDHKRMGIAGYSFGAMVALAGLKACKKARAFALVSIPGLAFNSLGKERGDRQFLFVTGEEDDSVKSEIIVERVAALGDRAQVQVVPGANHFWQGREEEMAGLVSRFFAKALV